jgi:hypothetical protein
MSEGAARVTTKAFKDSSAVQRRHDQAVASNGEHSAGTADTTTEACADIRPTTEPAGATVEIDGGMKV